MFNLYKEHFTAMFMAIFTIHDSCLISDIPWKYIIKLDGTVDYNNGKQFNTINIQ